MRWIDLSAYGMKLHLAVLPTARAFVVDGATAEHEQALKTLGFVQRKSGAWFKSGLALNPREWIRALPEAKVREMADEEYILKVSAQPGPVSVATAEDMPKPVVLGYNRLGQRVEEEEGRRSIVDAKGRRIREDQIGTPMHGMFLRAVDDGSFSMCAEGFIETVVNAPNEAFAKAPGFLEAIGRPPAELPAFLGIVEEALARHVLKKGGVSLRDKFAKAIEIKVGMRGADVPGSDRMDQVIMARRLLGMDKDLVGATIAMPDGSELLKGLLPRAVKTASTAADADYSVAFAATAGEAVGHVSGAHEGCLSALFVSVSEASDARDILKAVSEAGRIEAAALVSDEGLSHVALTVRSGPPGPVPTLARPADAAEAWSWASMVATDRSHAIESVKSGLSVDSDLNAADPSLGRNNHQVPYASASRAGTPRTMVPRELQDVTRQALDRVVAAFGDVDDRVAIECGYPRGELSAVLSPEQVDAIALAIHAEERDRAFLCADNTGVGKGRMLMSLAKRAVHQGRKVIVLSERDSNLSDLMRDVKHLNATDVINPAVLNRDVALIDETTEKPFEVADRSLLEAAIADGVWPEGINVVFATYSQFNKSAEESPRSAWLRNAIDGDVLFIGDEIHNAASGDSNISENVAAAIASAGSVALSSATFAVDAKMMAFFKRVFPHGLSAEEIEAMMRKGGEQFQEVVSAMLVADGVMIRREKDLSDLKISQHVDSARIQRNRDHMDRLAAVIGEMAMLSGDLDAAVARHNANETNALKGLQMKRMGFGSPLYTMTRLFTAALLAEYAAERAVDALRNGEKPIVLVENTIQALLDEASSAGGDAPDFKAVVHRIVDQMTKATVVREGDADRLDMAEGDHDFTASAAHIHQMIDDLPDFPASAIDEVRRRIELAGYTCGEITGRTLEVRDGKVSPRRNRDRTTVKNDFNSGKYDAVIINNSGATGVDLHASRRFKDQRRRVMIELQGQSRILKQLQAYGRISRYDEVIPSRIELLSSGLPSEVRLAAMRNQKLRRLSANVTSNRDSAFLAKNIPDIINSVGDAVVTRYADMRPDLIKRLCLAERDLERDDQIDANRSESQSDTDRSANEFLSRLSLLPVEHQEKVLAELTSEYEMHVAELEAKGENPLRPKELEGIVHVRQSKLFEGSNDSGSMTAFDGPMHILDVAIERVAEPIRAETVMKEVEQAAPAYARMKKAAQSLVRDRDMYLEPFLKKARTVQEAIAQGDQKIIRMVANMADLATAVEAFVPGREITFDLGGGETEHSVIVGVRAPEPGFEHLPNLYRVTIATPGATNTHTFRMDTLLSMPGVSSRDDKGRLKVMTSAGLEGSDYDTVLDRFETAVGRKLSSARILTTNIFRAVRLATQYGLGSLVSFVDQDGNRQRGVLVKKNFDRKLDMLSVRVDGIDGAYDALTDVMAEVTTSPTGSRTALTITPVSKETWTVKLPIPPKRRGEVMWPSQSYRDLFESGVEEDGRKARISCSGHHELRNVLEVLSESGIRTFYVAGKHREAINGNEGDDEPLRRPAA